MAKTKKLNNFIRSDGRTMTVVNKGEILCLREKGLSIKAIAGKVNRSMDWISTIIDTFGGTLYEKELITIWTTRSKIKDRTRVSRTFKRKTNKSHRVKSTTRTVSKHRVRRRAVVHTGQQDSGVQRTGKSGSIIKSLKKTNEYKKMV